MDLETKAIRSALSCITTITVLSDYLSLSLSEYLESGPEVLLREQLPRTKVCTNQETTSSSYPKDTLPIWRINISRSSRHGNNGCEVFGLGQPLFGRWSQWRVSSIEHRLISARWCLDRLLPFGRRWCNSSNHSLYDETQQA